MTSTYEVAPDGSWITCRRCKRTSYSHSDVKYLFCGTCGSHVPQKPAEMISAERVVRAMRRTPSLFAEVLGLISATRVAMPWRSLSLKESWRFQRHALNGDLVARCYQQAPGEGVHVYIVHEIKLENTGSSNDPVYWKALLDTRLRDAGWVLVDPPSLLPWVQEGDEWVRCTSAGDVVATIRGVVGEYNIQILHNITSFQGSDVTARRVANLHLYDQGFVDAIPRLRCAACGVLEDEAADFCGASGSRHNFVHT